MPLPAWHAAVRPDHPVLDSGLEPRVPPGISSHSPGPAARALTRCWMCSCAAAAAGLGSAGPQVGMGTGGRAPDPAPRPGAIPGVQHRGGTGTGWGGGWDLPPQLAAPPAKPAPLMRAPGSVYVQQAGAGPGDPIPLLAPHRRAPYLLGPGHWGPTHSLTWRCSGQVRQVQYEPRVLPPPGQTVMFFPIEFSSVPLGKAKEVKNHPQHPSI